MIEVKNYVWGLPNPGSTGIKIINDTAGKPFFTVDNLDEYAVSAAIYNATRTQKMLQDIDRKKITATIKKAMEYFFKETDYEAIVNVTGSPLSFTKSGIDFVKNWCKDLDPWLNKVLDKNVEYRGSAPVVCSLPGNSEYEFLYIVGQTLVSKNAVVIRPSSKGAGAYVAMRFIEAWLKAIGNDKSLECLKGAVSIVNTISGQEFTNQMAIDGWNYIIFGSDATVKEIEAAYREVCKPRLVAKFGTGFSSSVLMKSADEKAIKMIMESVATNRGDECDDTDILYVQANRDEFEKVVASFKKEALKHKGGYPFKKTIGVTRQGNVDFIRGELKRIGKSEHLDISCKEIGSNEIELLNTCVVPLSEYDKAIEYPGPVLSVRSFKDLDHLGELILKDLLANNMDRSLVTSVYGSSADFKKVQKYLRAYIIKHNKMTNDFNLLLPHQGVLLIEALSDKKYFDM